MNNIQSPLIEFVQSGVEIDTSPKSLLDFINAHNSDCEIDDIHNIANKNDDNIQSPLIEFVQSDVGIDTSPKTLFDFINAHNSDCEIDETHNITNKNDEPESPKTLLDFINAHTSQKNEDDISSLSDLTSRHLNLRTLKGEGFDKVSSLEVTNENLLENECDTLEEYTKLFLNSKGNNVFQYRKPKPCTPFVKNCSKKNIEENDLQNVAKKMSDCYISDLNKSGTRKINLNAALENKLKQSLLISQIQNSSEVSRSKLSVSLDECCLDFSFLDISCLLDQDLIYSDSELSSFGHVACKKWDRPLLRSRFRKIEKIRPYNVAKSFKFDTPSPDDTILKTRERNNSVNEP